MTANQRNINDLRFLTRNNLIIPYNLDIRENRTSNQFVTQFFLNLPDCLYTKKFCDFLQSYEKTREEQNKLVCFFWFIRHFE